MAHFQFCLPQFNFLFDKDNEQKSLIKESRIEKEDTTADQAMSHHVTESSLILISWETLFWERKVPQDQYKFH